jgi:hypothetical protein
MPDLERYRLIACSVFTRELCAFVASSPRIVDPEFLELAAHEQSFRLRALLQEAVDRAEGKGYAAVLLGYGLCGNSLAGVRARSIPLVVPRAHDCCTILLGSRAAFHAEFGEELSASWTSCGYFERSADYMRRSESGRSAGFGLSMEEMIEKYGEENAAYLWETLHPPVDDHTRRFIELSETEAIGRSTVVRADAERTGREFRLIRGDSRLLKALVDGQWNDDEFLVVPPGEAVRPVYDYDRVVEARENDAGASG